MIYLESLQLLLQHLYTTTTPLVPHYNYNTSTPLLLHLSVVLYSQAGIVFGKLIYRHLFILTITSTEETFHHELQEDSEGMCPLYYMHI